MLSLYKDSEIDEKLLEDMILGKISFVLASIIVILAVSSAFRSKLINSVSEDCFKYLIRHKKFNDVGYTMCRGRLSWIQGNELINKGIVQKS